MSCCSKSMTKANRDNETALVHLLNTNELEQFSDMLDRMLWKGDFLRTCADICISNKLWDFLKLVIDKGLELDESQSLKILYGTDDNEQLFIELLEDLIKNKSHLKNISTPILLNAVQKGWCKVVKFLLDQGCDPNKMLKVDCFQFRANLLHAAVLLGFQNIVSLLLTQPNVDPGVPYGDECKTIVHLACDINDHDVLEIILSKCHKLIERRDSFMEGTPLQRATMLNCAKCVKLLLRSGADVNAETTTSSIANRHTPLMMAVSRSNLEIATILLRHPECNINAKDSSSAMTALHRAADIGDIHMVSLLLEHGADPNPVDADLATPLSLAVNERHMDTAMTLLPYIGDPDPYGQIYGMACDRQMHQLLGPLILMGSNITRPSIQCQNRTDLVRLKFLCKIYIRKTLGVVRRTVTEKLGLPSNIVDYLHEV